MASSIRSPLQPASSSRHTAPAGETQDETTQGALATRDAGTATASAPPSQALGQMARESTAHRPQRGDNDEDAALHKAMGKANAANRRKIIERFRNDAAAQAKVEALPGNSNKTVQLEIDIRPDGVWPKVALVGTSLECSPDVPIAPAEAQEPGTGRNGMWRQIDEVDRNRDNQALLHGKAKVATKTVEFGKADCSDASHGWVKLSEGRGAVEGEVVVNVKKGLGSLVTGVGAAFARFVTDSEVARSVEKNKTTPEKIKAAEDQAIP